MAPLLPAAAAAGAGILVGTGIVATRFVIEQTDPASLAFMRYLIGAVCLLPVAAAAGRVKFAARDHLPICLLGITQFGILILLLNFGLTTISSALGAVLFATFPMITLLLSAALKQESITRNKVLGVALTVAGVALALGDKLVLPERNDGLWIGALAVLASAFSGALCSVLYRPYLRRYPALQVSAYAMLASVLFLAFPAAHEDLFTPIPSSTARGWLAIVFIGLSSAAGYFLWLWALRHSSPTKVTIFLALNPIAATALGAALLSERISLLFLMGLACVVAGIWMAYRTPRAQAG